MKFMVDIDGTICTITDGEYEKAKPYRDRISLLNDLYDQGHEIHYWTARGSNSGIDWSVLTQKQLSDWKVKYTSLKLGKPSYDLWIDDKAENSEHFFERIIDRL